MHVGDFLGRDRVLKQDPEQPVERLGLEKVEAGFGAQVGEVCDHCVQVRREFEV